MSSQDATGIPLGHAPDGRGYRLMELPIELESLLLAEDTPRITLESSPTSALLKTPDRTYSLRQKNTSNALIILAPTQSASSSDIPSSGLAAIATVHETIELIPVVEPLPKISNLKNTGSKGKWHEKFGSGR